MLSLKKVLQACTYIAAAWIVLSIAGCGGSDNIAVQPQRFAIDAAPNGIAVRPDDGALFVTDDTTNSVLLAPDARTFAHYATILTVAGQSNSLSQLFFTAPRSVFIARFGFGTAGGVFYVSAPDTVAALAGGDPARRRLGLVQLDAGRMLSTWFVKGGQGGVSLMTYDVSTGATTERDLWTGLGKPVGVAVSGNKVFVTDQANNAVLSAPLDTLLASAQPVTAGTVVAQISGPDLIAADDDGNLYTKCNATGFCKIAPNGTVTVIANDFQGARGVAVDPPRHALYVVDRSAAGGTSYIHVLPL